MMDGPLELAACPEQGCDMPFEIDRRYYLPGTDGPLEMIYGRCLDGHQLNMPASMLHDPPPEAINRGPFSYSREGDAWVIRNLGRFVAKFEVGRYSDAAGCARRSTKFMNETHRSNQ